MIRNFRLGALAVLLASPTMPGAIQTAARAQADPTTLSAPPAVATPAPVQAAVLWNVAAARELLSYVEAVGEEGLDPAAYSPERRSEERRVGKECRSRWERVR